MRRSKIVKAAARRGPRTALSVVASVEIHGIVGPRWLRSRLLEIARLLGLENPRITVVIVGDAKMAELHERYAGAKGTTDVLTFDLSDPQVPSLKPQASRLDGEIYISLDEACRRAIELDHEPRLELLLYAIHGLLHLTGYDDQDPESYRCMHSKEDELLKAIGIGPIFAAGKGGGA